LHANFRLGADGESIVLSAPDGSTVDLVSFGPQAEDVSEGRWPDGSTAAFRPLTQPTPGAANVWSAEIRLGGAFNTGQGQIIAFWPSTPGQQFQIQYKDNLEDPAWLPAGQPITASDTQTQVAIDITSASARRFYRLVLLGL
jgi:hypothetical protein